MATVIEEGAGGSDIDTAMQSWWRWRDADAYAMYWFASMMGSVGEQSVLTNRMMKVVADDPAATVTMFRVLNHQRPAGPARTSPGAGDVPRLLVEAIPEVAQRLGAAVGILHHPPMPQPVEHFDASSGPGGNPAPHVVASDEVVLGG